MFSPLEQFDVMPLMSLWYNNYDLTLFNMFVPLLLMNFLFWNLKFLNFYFKLMPYSFQSIFEKIMGFIFSIMKSQMGKEGYMFFPFIFTIFSFVLFANLLSIIPFGMALTSHLMVTMWLSLSMCSGMFILGLVCKNLKFLKIFMPKCPLALLPVLIMIELFSYIMSAFSLSISLTANMLAGHTLVNIVSLFMMNTLAMNYFFSCMGLTLIFAILLLELGVACLQAYVLTMLVCMYLKDVLSEGGH